MTIHQKYIALYNWYVVWTFVDEKRRKYIGLFTWCAKEQKDWQFGRHINHIHILYIANIICISGFLKCSFFKLFNVDAFISYVCSYKPKIITSLSLSFLEKEEYYLASGFGKRYIFVCWNINEIKRERRTH